MWLILTPALIGLLLKLFLLYFNLKLLTKKPLLTILGISVLLSAVELAVLMTFFQGQDIDILFRFYYVASIWWAGIALAYVCHITRLMRYIVLPVISLLIVMSYLFIFTDLIISGYRSAGYAPTAIKNHYYWIFQIFAISSISVSILLLIKKSFFSHVQLEEKMKYIYLLMAFLLPFATIVTIVTLMQIGININAATILPTVTTIFVFFMIRSEQGHGLIDFRKFIPCSPEKQFSTEVAHIAKLYSLNKVSFKDAKLMNEAALTKYAVAISKKSSIPEMADKFDIPKSTLYSLINKHNLSNAKQK